MKYKKKPVVIEAFQYTIPCSKPLWYVEAIESGVVVEGPYATYIKTLEGNMAISLKDYVIKGVKGEIYPCKSDIFEMTYEKVEE